MFQCFSCLIEKPHNLSEKNQQNDNKIITLNIDDKDSSESTDDSETITLISKKDNNKISKPITD